MVKKVIETEVTKSAGLADKLKSKKTNSLQKVTPKEVKVPHIIVSARAGSGKTTSLVVGVVNMFRDRIQGLWPALTSKLGFEFIPSPQQQAIWDCMKLSAEWTQTIKFTAFNKSIVDDFYNNWQWLVDLLKVHGIDFGFSTMHIMGYSAVRYHFPGLKKPNEWRLHEIVAEVMGGERKQIAQQQPFLFNSVLDMTKLVKQNLIPLDAEDDNEQAVVNSMLIDLAQHYGVELEDDYGKSYATEVLQMLPDVLARCMDVNKDQSIDFDDMLWLPIAAGLSCFKNDMLLCDELQDMNRCQHALARKCGHRVVGVGDERQCQPAGTMVATVSGSYLKFRPHKIINKPIESIKVGDRVWGYSISDCYFYSSSVVEAVSSRQFIGNLITVTMPDGRSSSYTNNHKCLVSFASLRNKYVVYLMRRGSQYRIGMSKIEQPGNQGTGPFMRLRNSGGDALWILGFYDTRKEALMMESAIGGRFGIPQLMFNNESCGNTSMDVKYAWEYIGDNSVRGLECLKFFNKDVLYPLITPETGTLRGESSLPSMKRPMLVYASNIENGCLMLPFNISKRHASKSHWQKVTISKTFYKGRVYSLRVSKDETYVADGIATHNSIYGFAGADTASMYNFRTELEKSVCGCAVFPLTVTRRCAKAIVKEANKIVKEFEAHENNPEGLVRTARYHIEETNAGRREVPYDQTYMPLVNYGDMIICRINAPLVQTCFRFLRMGRRAFVQGRKIGEGLITLIDKLTKHDRSMLATELVLLVPAWASKEIGKEQSKKNPSQSVMIGIQDRADCIMAFCADGMGTVQQVVDRINTLFSDDTKATRRANSIMLSSIHKAKGLEASNVFLLMPRGAGFEPRNKMKEDSWQVEQLENLLYVGITRAINTLTYVR